ncbi:MAG: IS1595 family transposase [Planctomycetes bacterium]|nr:IS1595 family transposase [Planctomycetota bacterium]
MHRIRWAMAENYGEPEKLSGTVEIDETFIGGKPRYKGWTAGRAKPRAHFSTKTRVVAMVERGGSVRAEVSQGVTARNIRQIVRENVDTSSRIITDELRAYRRLGPEYAQHDHVNHGRGEYVRGDVTTNTIEGFFSLVKRGMYGTFHSVSRKHLHRYMSEFSFRYNTRKLDDGARTDAAIRASVGKRLLYREPVERAGA